MTIAWAVVLVVLSKTFTSTTEDHTRKSPTTPQVTMLLRHVGCNEQSKADVVRALASLPWLDTVAITTGEPEPTSGKEEEGHQDPCMAHIVAAVKDVQEADFMQLIKSVSAIGIAPKAIEFGGLAHFTLVAKVSDLSCKSCKRAALDAMTPLKVSVTYYATTNQGEIDPAKITSFKWLEGKSINQSEHTIRARVYSNRTARIDEMIRALEGAGFRPLSVRIVVEKA
jgi:hypothetical protein